MLKFELNDIVPEPPNWLNWLVNGNTEPKTPAMLCTRAAVLVIDISQSMEASDYPPTRLGAAQEAALAFASQLAAEDSEATVALVAYNGSAKCVCPPTTVTARRPFESALAALRPSGCTSIAAGLKVAEKVLHRVAASQKQVVLLTDGHSNDGNPPVSIAQRIHQTAIIDCVGIGGQPSDVNEELLMWVASLDDNGRRRYRWIGDRQQLVTHFKRLAGRIVA